MTLLWFCETGSRVANAARLGSKSTAQWSRRKDLGNPTPPLPLMAAPRIMLTKGGQPRPQLTCSSVGTKPAMGAELAFVLLLTAFERPDDPLKARSGGSSV